MDKSYYILDIIELSDTRLFAGGQVIEGVDQSCPVCKTHLPLQSGKAIKIALNHIGKQGFVEYLWNSHSLPILRSDVFEHWSGMGLSGYITRPVEIIGWYQAKRQKLPQNIPNYYCVIPTHQVRLSEPPPRDQKKCDYCGFVAYAFPKISTHLPNGLSLVESTLDDSDFYGLIGYNFIFCSKRVLEVTLPKKYKHIAFVPISKYGVWESFNIKKWATKDYDDYIKGFLIREMSDLDKYLLDDCNVK